MTKNVENDIEKHDKLSTISSLKNMTDIKYERADKNKKNKN